MRITGSGTVNTVQANGDHVQVDVEGAAVTAGKGSSNVTAGGAEVAVGETVTVEADDSDSGDNNDNNGDNDNNDDSSSSTDNPGGSSGGNTDNPGTTPGGGESSGGNTETPGGETETTASLVNAEATKLVDLGWSQYVTVQFSDGHSLENTTLTIDGTDVTSAFTPVTDDASIVKWEITDLNPAQLVATSGGDTQTVTLSNNADPEKPEVVTNTARDYMIAHGAVSVWDYHLTNYDKDGNVRVEPAKTTFNLSGTEATDVPAYYSQDAELSAEGTGSVVIQFALESDADKAWFDAVSASASGTVQLVAYNENLNTLNDHLTCTKAVDGDTGTITIALGQDNFYSNGRYYVRIASTNHDSALVPIHVVNAKAPSLQLSGSGSAIQSGQDVRFTISDMTYGITNPTYAAELTRPDGTTVQLEMIEDWYQIGDSLVLYNDKNNNIPYNGTYTLTVHSNGFKDMSISFSVSGGEAAPNAQTRGLAVDAVSRATSSSGGGESSTMGANLKFDADLLINAKLLVSLGIANEAAQGINDRWEYDMSGWDTVHTADGTAYNWTDYINAVRAAEAEGDYLSFDEYAESADKDTTGTPYAIKSVLEDNLLGETQQNGTWIGMTPPALSLVDSGGSEIDAVLEGDALILQAENGDYFSKLERIVVNNNALPLSEEDYTLSDDKTTLTIESTVLTPGQANSIAIYAEGYKVNHLSVRCAYDLETGLTLSADKDSYNRKDTITLTIAGSEGDFLSRLQSATAAFPNGTTYNIDKQGENAYASDAHYSVSEDKKTLTISDPEGKFFSENGTYTITLSAKGYNALTTTIAVNGETEEPEKPGKQQAPAAPTVEMDESNNVLLKFSDSINNWQFKVTSIKVNDTDYTKFEDFFGTPGNNQYEWQESLGQGIDTLYLDKTAFTAGENTVVISAEGYEDLTVTVTISGTETPDAEQEAPAIVKYEKTSFWGGNKLYFDDQNGTYDDQAKAYLNAITKVTVAGETYSPVTSSLWLEDNNYYASISDTEAHLELSTNGFSTTDNTTIVIEATGYKDLTVTIDKDGHLVK